MGDVYYYTALPQGGEGRGVGRKGKTFPFPFLFLGDTEATPGVESSVSAQEAGDFGAGLKFS